MSGEFPAAAASNQNNQSQSAAFAAAVQRAREIAAKIHPVASAAGEGQKRSFEDTGSSGEPDAKKQAVSFPSSSTGASGISGTTTAAQQAAVQAAAVAARVAAAAAAGIQGVGLPGLPLGPVITKDIKVPDKMVGLIIGRGGEQISRLQAESGCKIQMAPDSGGLPERTCTLSGNAKAISTAEDLISQIVQSRSREILPGSGGVGISTGPMSNSSTGSGGIPASKPQGGGNSAFTQVEIMIPGPKVGLVIGKGGETIKQLQEKTGAKMIVIQDTASQEPEKPLRISGEAHRVEQARNMVYEIISDKDPSQQRRGGGRGGPHNGFNGGGGGQGGSRHWDSDQTETTLVVPAVKCGVIIGKGGETIRQINQQTGAHCEIDRRQQTNVNEKVFVIRGTAEQIESAKRMFSEKLNMNFGGSNGPTNGYPSGERDSMRGNYNSGPSSWAAAVGNGPQGGYPQPWQNSSGQNQQQPQQPNPPSAAGGTPGQVQMNPITGQPDYSAQWIEYYRSMGMHREAAIVEEQAKAAKMSSGGPVAPALTTTQHQMPMQGQQKQQVTVADLAAGQQPDYSAQWATYYRSIGKVQEAEAIEAQIKAKASGQPQPVATQQAGAVGMYNQQAVGNAQQYPLGSYAGSAGFYNATQQQGAGNQFAYANYAGYQGQQNSANETQTQ